MKVVNKIFLISAFIVSALSMTDVFAQSLDSTFNNFVLSDYSKIKGTIVFKDENNIQIRNLSGDEIRINKQNIISKKVLKRKVIPSDTLSQNLRAKIEEKFEDPTISRLFLTPTARNLKAGNGYIALNEMFSPNILLGLTDRISASAYLLILPTPFDFGYLLLSTQINVFHDQSSDISLGLLGSKNFGKNDWGYALYGMYSLYNSSALFNVGAGFAPISKKYLLTIGGEIKIDEKNKFVFDNWFYSDDQLLLSFGGKTFSKHFSFALGIIAAFGNEKKNSESIEVEFQGVGSWLSFAYYFSLSPN